MAAEILVDAGLWVGEYELRDSMNAIALDMEVETQDCTCFGDGSRSYALGLPRVAFSAGGYPIDDATDGVLFDLMGQGSLVMTVTKARSNGAVAYVGKILDAAYSSLMSVNEVRRFNTTGELSSRSFGRGRLLHIGTAVAATGTSTGIQLRAITAGKKAFATVHMTAVAGTDPEFDLVIESDDNSGFTSATTRATFTQLTDVGSQMVDIDGAVTDTYWRASWTIAGTDPEFTFAVALGFEEPV